MVPHTYPTIEGRLVLGVITDITGLNEWQDYIPVVAQTNPVASSRNTFANDGYMGVNVLSSLTGLNAWIDYIPCYVVTGRSSPFSVSPDGYISVSAEVGTLGGASLADYIINSKTPDLVADFNGSLNDSTEFYDAGGTVDTFAELITHSRAGNATMTDGYGPELVTNGTFNNSDGWSTGAGWEISNGQATRITGTYSELLYTFPSALQAGKTYTIEFTAPISGIMAIGFIGPIVTSAYATRSGATAITLTATGSHTGLRFIPGGSGTDGAIDNVSVREIPAIKWAPHNLLRYSEDFSNPAWLQSSTPVLTPGQLDPSGNTTATKLELDVSDGIFQTYANAAGDYTFALWVKGDTSGTITLSDASSGGFAVNVNVTTEWTLVSTGSQAISGFYSPYIYRASGDLATIYVAFAHAYRSDLGGMVDNPDRGDSYVPTTSSAVYLPRRNHHVYNGSAWVNEGVLHESEARTNLVTYSDFDSLGWQDGAATQALTRNAAVSPDGTQNALKVETISAGASSFVRPIVSVFGGGEAATVSVYAKAGTHSLVRIANGSSGENGAWFNLADSTIGTQNDISGNGNTASIEDVGNGWYRLSRYFGSVSAGSNSIIIGPSDVDGSTGPSPTNSTMYFYGVQAEVGPTPSSLIPTNGATVSRALETLTIPAVNMPWPEPNYLGPELVVNGDFSNGTTGWTVRNSSNATIAEVSGQLVTTVVSSGANGVYQEIPTVVGKVYTLSSLLVSKTALNVRIRVGTSIGGTQYDTLSPSSNGQTSTLTFKATSTSLFYELGYDSNPTAGDTFVWDNVSVREIDPLSVSIQMQGRMTYADTATSNEAVFAYWNTDSSNFIRLRLRTDGSNTGAIGFDQSFSGTFDFVAQDFYSPSILVPYNIASRHGSTFINGAVDGTALTANTTPTALPDLSSTNFSLAYDYMGTISMFRVWADDLADVGIAEATEPSEVPSLQLTFDNSETSFTIQDWEQ